MPVQLPNFVCTAIEKLENAGFEAYAVGGCVRDSLLHKTPNDWDIATSARPEETAAVFAGCRTVETGVKHGTLTVIWDSVPLEITTYRNDGEYKDNRHPVAVTFSSHIEDDLSRRDFTVNAMAYHPQRGLVDLFDGQKDLSAGIIACVGEPSVRFHEDGLRILRAIRFASVLGFSIESKTAAAVHACRSLLKNIAAERIREEFCKLLCGVNCVRILREYWDIVTEILPELAPCIGFSQNSRYHCYDVWEHTLHALEYAPNDLIVRLALLFHDIGKPHCYTEDENGGHFKGHAKISTALAKTIMQKLRFDCATAERVLYLVENHDIPIKNEPKAVKRLMQQISDEDIVRLTEIQRCDRLAHAAPYCIPPADLAEIPKCIQAIRAANECLSLKSLKINGNDLMALGIPAGKQIGALLSNLLECVIDGTLPNDRDMLLQAAREQILASK